MTVQERRRATEYLARKAEDLLAALWVIRGMTADPTMTMERIREFVDAVLSGKRET